MPVLVDLNSPDQFVPWTNGELTEKWATEKWRTSGEKKPVANNSERKGQCAFQIL
jgi:hypothetical protein